MSYRFELQVTRVECVNEQVWEWGKDEMHLIGFGVSRKGVLFATGYRSLGSYQTGDVRTSGEVPLNLFEGELADDGLDVVLYFWLVEEDGGGVGRAASALEAEFRAAYLQQASALTQIQFPRECIPFTAFYKAILPLEASVQDAAKRGRDDEVFYPVDLFLRHAPDGPAALRSSKEVTAERSKRLGHYRVTLRYSHEPVPVVLQ